MRHITVIHPSRGRAQLCKKAFENVLMGVDSDPNFSHLHYVVAIEPDQAEEYSKVFYENKTWIDCRETKSAIEAINFSVRSTPDVPDIIVIMSDDFVLPKGWDTMIREAVGDKTDFVLKTFDTTQKWICTLPIMDKVYYDRFGYVYNPSYKHMFADTELTHVAELLGKLIVRNDIVFPHRTEVTGNDAINKKNNSTWAQGEALYLERVKQNFGLPEELRKPVSYKPHQQWINQKIK